MRRIFFLIYRRLSFFWRAKTRHDIHSPFLAEFVEKVVEDNRWFYAFSDIEEMRRLKRKQDKELIAPSTLGAGTQFSTKPKISAGVLMHRSAVPPETGRQLFRLALWLQPGQILELGTAQGISTAYLAAADRRTKIISVEGHPPLAKKATQFLQSLDCGHVKIINSDFESALPEALQSIGSVDLLFIDGDHRGDMVIHYAMSSLEYQTERTVWVIADIHWSNSMYDAWKKLINFPGVSYSVDLFHLGIIFFNASKPTPPQHVALVPASWKPWRIGLWGG
jgi:predicted O-methyltransferase YrrM